MVIVSPAENPSPYPIKTNFVTLPAWLTYNCPENPVKVPDPEVVSGWSALCLINHTPGLCPVKTLPVPFILVAVTAPTPLTCCGPLNLVTIKLPSIGVSSNSALIAGYPDGAISYPIPPSII